MNVKNIFSIKEKDALVQAIEDAELNTSGEIRVHIENYCKGDPVERAQYWFNRLKINQTRQRNGILFYLAVKSRKFAVIGDEGIHQAVGEDYWKKVRDIMLEQFYNNDFIKGLILAIELTGNSLKQYFPYQTDDINELPDEISFNDN